jgi:raffinose/stachyose/melibiose transport system substrate-binding protein
MRTLHTLRISIATILVVSTMMLAACSPAPAATTEEPATENPTEPAEATQEGSESEATSEATEAPATEAANSEPVTLTYWSMWHQDEPQGQVVQKAIDDFQAANPNVTVNVVWNGRDNRKLLVPALEAGESIDLFDGGIDYVVPNMGKYLLPLESYLDQPAVGSDMTVGESVNQALLNQQPFDGKIVAMPYQPFAVLFFYNKDHFAAAGIDAPPATWDELLEDNQKLVDAGFAPITTDVDAYVDIILGYYLQRATGSCDFLQQAMADKTGEMWTDPVVQQMANDFADLNDKGYMAPETSGNLYPAGQQQLALGTVTMYLNGTWLPVEVKDTAGPDFNWGSFSFPAVTDGKGSVNDVMMGSQGIGISNKSEHPDQAFEFIKYLVSKDVQSAFVSDANVPAVSNDVTWTGDLEDASNIVHDAESALPWACDLGNGGDIVANVVLPDFTDLLVGKLTADEFIEKISADTANFYSQ